MIVSDLKTFAKKSRTIHSTYKLVRGARNIPPKKWFNIEQLSAIFNVLPNTMLPMPRLFDAYDAIVSVNREGLLGDVVECGVWNGGCVGLMALANAAEPGPKRKFHLFDSFQGLPQPSSDDMDVIDDFKDRHPELDLRNKSNCLTPIGACVGNSQPSVEHFLVKQLGISKEDLVFHVGWFQDTVPFASQAISNIALLRLDGDWYDSTKACLEGLYGKVVQNGYVIIDDYGTFSGCRKAVNEFFEKNGIHAEVSYSDSECISFRKTQRP
jgi:O-methyltransferase